MNEDNESTQEELREQFERFDADKNGLLDVTEFQRLLRALGDDAPDETLALQFAPIDTNDDGFVTFEEFSAWWQS